MSYCDGKYLARLFPVLFKVRLKGKADATHLHHHMIENSSGMTPSLLLPHSRLTFTRVQTHSLSKNDEKKDRKGLQKRYQTFFKKVGAWNPFFMELNFLIKTINIPIRGLKLPLEALNSLSRLHPSPPLKL